MKTQRQPRERPAGEAPRAPPGPKAQIPRSEPRQRTHLREGKLFDSRRRFITDCLVLDISKHGLRLKIHGNVTLTPLLVMFDERTSRMFHGELRWQRDGEIGLYVRTGTD